MTSKLIGSILMILGTSIGAGMIALPVVTATESLTTTILTIFGCWAISTLGAYALAEVALRLPRGNNLISMSHTCFGNIGRVVAWILYLLLMYSLTCAYLSGTTEMVTSVFSTAGLFENRVLSRSIVLGIFAFILYRGIKLIDPLNRGLMLLKFILYVTLLSLTLPHLDIDNLISALPSNLAWPTGIITVILTSFGYSVIIPTLTDYLNQDRRKIITAILVGSILPLIIYILWILVIQSVIPRDGPHGLLSILSATNTNEALFNSMNTLTANRWISRSAEIFMPVSLITSFLGVSLSLRDFLADGLKLKKHGLPGLILIVCTLLPPTVIITAAPGIFLSALSHAGIICFVLLILLPIAMLLRTLRMTIDQNNT